MRGKSAQTADSQCESVYYNSWQQTSPLAVEDPYKPGVKTGKKWWHALVFTFQVRGITIFGEQLNAVS